MYYQMIAAFVAFPQDRDVGRGSCDVYEIKYREESIPPILRQKTNELLSMYESMREFLKPYKQLECEGDGCPSRDELTGIVFVDFLKGEENKCKHSVCNH